VSAAVYKLGMMQLCQEPAPKRGLSHCIREHNHDGAHVYYSCSRTSITYYDSFLRALTHADLKPGAEISFDEAAALWAYLEAIKESRAKKQEGEESDRGDRGAGSG
jgi:hypothetical protein